MTDPSAMTVQRKPAERATALDLYLGATGRVNLILAGPTSVIAAILIAQFIPGRPVPLWLCALIAFPTMTTVVAVFLALRKAVALSNRHADTIDANARELPTTVIVDVVSSSAPYSHCTMLVIVKWSQTAALPVGSNVKVAIAEEHHERHLGLGTVRDTLTTGNYVVSVDHVYDGTEVRAYIERLVGTKDTKNELLPRIRIGSTISFQNLSANMLASLTVPASPVAALPAASPVPALPVASQTTVATVSGKVT